MLISTVFSVRAVRVRVGIPSSFVWAYLACLRSYVIRVSSMSLFVSSSYGIISSGVVVVGRLKTSAAGSLCTRVVIS